jgi:hypothetical protein
MRSGAPLASAVAAFAVAASPVAAACPQEHGVYTEEEAHASLEFRAAPEGAASHEFRLIFAENDVSLDGVVMWTDDPARPIGMLMHDCPEGDVTGEELAACTVWQGVIYTVSEFGAVGLLPQRGAAAAVHLLLPDLGAAVRNSSLWGADQVTQAPWDAFTLSGCQE